MKQYVESLKTILDEGVKEPSRTGVDRIRYHGIHYRFDLSEGKLPIVTTKKMATRVLIEELLWFLRGGRNIRPLLEKNVHIWTADAFKKYSNSKSYEGETMKEFEERILSDDKFAAIHGDLGPVYGHQWRKRSGYIDQIKNAIETIKNNPQSSRIIIDSWNPEELNLMTLPPCHYSFQLTVMDGKLNLQMNQRSGDMFLGVPFNITSYSILLSLLAEITGLERGVFTHTIGDAHIYENHVEPVNEQLKNDPLELPKLVIKNVEKYGANFEKYTTDDFVIEGYKSHQRIKGELSV